MPRANRISYLGATILREGAYWRAYLPRARGHGRLKYRRKDLDKVKAWVEANAGPAAQGIKDFGPRQVAEYTAATEILAGTGLSILEAAKIAADTTGVKPTKKTLAEDIETYLQLLESAGRRPRTIESAAWALRKLRPWHSGPTAAVTRQNIFSIILAAASPTTRDNIRRQISSFFRWAIRAELCAKNPCDAIPGIRKDWREPAIYTPEQVAAIFRAAEKNYSRAIPYLALSYFSGIRSSAIADIRPAHFHRDSILVQSASAKARKPYTTKITPTLRRWLKKYPLPATGPIPCSTYHFTRRITAKIHAAAGIPRIPNGARHSYASYLLAIEKNAPAVALQLGHFGETKTLFAHYRRIATPAAARKYFAISPE